MKEYTSRRRLLAAVLTLCVVTEAGSSPIYSPTSSWSSSQQSGGAGDPGEQYPRGGGLPRSRHFPPSASRPEDRYNMVAQRHQYTYNRYPHHNMEAKASQLDYEIDHPYQNEVNIYEYSYTESSAYNEPNVNKYNRGGGRRTVASSVMGLPRVWWPGVRLPSVLTSRRDPYLSRVMTSEGQQRQVDRTIENAEGEEAERFSYSAGHKPASNVNLLLQNDSLIGMVRVQKSLHPTWDTAAFSRDLPGARQVTTPAPGAQRSRHRSGFDSLLQMMNHADKVAQEKVSISDDSGSAGASPANKLPDEEVPLRVSSSSRRSGSSSSSTNCGGSDKGETQQVLPRVGGSSGPHTPITTTAVLCSIMLLILLVVVMVALRVQWRERTKAEEEWPVRSPTVQPPTPASAAAAAAAAASVGPSPGTPHHLDPLTHLHPEPIRIKAKGLLERRGSNTSLTLELAPNCPPPEVTSPPRHCTPEEFLMTAGNRMSRRQLRMCLKEVRALHAEFWEVPLNQPDKCDVPGSASKNRYRTVLPNEATRVRLHTGDPATEYINANFVRGYDGEERAYIVTQGPLAHTVADLWRLVMQERCPAVVMITRLKEKQRVKCEPYVPAHTAIYGLVTVTVTQVIQKSGYTIRKVFLQCGQDTHETLHFWYTAWPDHKAPTDPDQLLALALQVDHIRKAGEGEQQGPVVVHCSAGIGRSGCFVAISIAINQLLEEDCVDILGIVCQMRLDRGGMVQTGEQYEFIHRAVALYASTLPSVSSGK
ncbi:uncharacterized protein [Panulirus ornatus]|uniref:uncharacterized protein isoform X2 n=1 Tax=Panulirus ornatus TaxID=150431 RepID=UPI003A86E570